MVPVARVRGRPASDACGAVVGRVLAEIDRRGPRLQQLEVTARRGERRVAAREIAVVCVGGNSQDERPKYGCPTLTSPIPGSGPTGPTPLRSVRAPSASRRPTG